MSRRRDPEAGAFYLIVLAIMLPPLVVGAVVAVLVLL